VIPIPDIGTRAIEHAFQAVRQYGHSTVTVVTAASCDSGYLDLNGVYGYVTPKLAQWPTVL